MKIIRQWYWYLDSIIKRHSRIIFLSILLGIFSTVIGAQLYQHLPQRRVLYIGRVGNFSLSQLPLDIQELVSEGLTATDNSGNPKPALAQSWEIKDAGKTFRFVLDPGKTFSDGQPITATDVSYSFNHIKVIKEDSHTLSFQLKDSFPPFLSVVSQPIFKRKNARFLFFFKKPQIIGTKEYLIDKVQTNSNNLTSLTLKSKSQKLIYRFYPTEESAIVAFKQGRVDRLEHLSDPRELNKWPNVVIEPTLNFDQYVALFFNLSSEDLASKPLRQLLAYATPDKNQGGQRTLSPINPKSWAHNPQVKPYHFDENTVKKSIEKEFAANNKPLPKLELTTTPTFSTYADKIAKTWSGFGIETTLKITNFPDTAHYQVLLIGQKTPPDPDQYPLWHSTQPTNVTHYNSPRVDKLLEDGRKTVGQDERILIYQDFQRFLVEDVPAVFLYYLTTYTISRH